MSVPENKCVRELTSVWEQVYVRTWEHMRMCVCVRMSVREQVHENERTYVRELSHVSVNTWECVCKNKHENEHVWEWMYTRTSECECMCENVCIRTSVRKSKHVWEHVRMSVKMSVHETKYKCECECENVTTNTCENEHTWEQVSVNTRLRPCVRMSMWGEVYMRTSVRVCENECKVTSMWENECVRTCTCEQVWVWRHVWERERVSEWACVRTCVWEQVWAWTHMWVWGLRRQPREGRDPGRGPHPAPPSPCPGTTKLWEKFKSQWDRFPNHSLGLLSLFWEKRDQWRGSSSTGTTQTNLLMSWKPQTCLSPLCFSRNAWSDGCSKTYNWFHTYYMPVF